MKGSCSPSRAIACAMTNTAPYTAGTVSSAMPYKPATCSAQSNKCNPSDQADFNDG